MPDEVTKRDLQALQANFNKQIADLKKSIDSHQKFNEDSAKFDDSIKKNVEALQKFADDSTKFDDWAKNSIQELDKVVTQHAKVINEKS